VHLDAPDRAEIHVLPREATGARFPTQPPLTFVAGIAPLAGDAVHVELPR
jgi:hypothetical protein